MQNKKNLYKWIKLSGLITFIPFVMISGPIAGYYIGMYLKNVFGFRDAAFNICIVVGCIAGMYETVRLIRKIIKIGK